MNQTRGREPASANRAVDKTRTRSAESQLKTNHSSGSKEATIVVPFTARSESCLTVLRSYRQKRAKTWHRAISVRRWRYQNFAEVDQECSLSSKWSCKKHRKSKGKSLRSLKIRTSIYQRMVSQRRLIKP